MRNTYFEGQKNNILLNPVLISNGHQNRLSRNYYPVSTYRINADRFSLTNGVLRYDAYRVIPYEPTYYMKIT